jgi:hypothetical protein
MPQAAAKRRADAIANALGRNNQDGVKDSANACGQDRRRSLRARACN